MQGKRWRSDVACQAEFRSDRPQNPATPLTQGIGRRTFLRGAAGAMVGSAMLPLMGQSTSADRPNFLFLFTDDQTFRSINALNNPEVHTPNLDRLARRGVVFTHCFNQGSWSGAVCICSRAMLNTGQYVYHAKQNIGSAPLWGQTFREAGYDTFLTGKWHNGTDTALRSFETGVAIGAGMYDSKGQYGRPDPENPGDWTPDDASAGGHWQPRVWDVVTGADGKPTRGEPYRVHRHTSELYAEHAIEYLMSPDRADAPFLMYVSFNAPHDPRQSPRRFLDMYHGDTLTVPPNYLPEHPFDQGDHRIRDERLAPFPRTKRAVQLHLSEYYAIITHFDEQIGRILDALQVSGRADNTIIVFSSDHGLAVGQHGLMGKQNQYDHSVRMPMILAGPGIQAGRRVSHMVYLHSLFATTCDLAGIPTPDTVEFPSIAGLVTGASDQPVHDAIFGSYRHYQRMVRTENWKLILYPIAERRQLFDLKNDPWETTDLSDDPAQAQRIRSLEQQLRNLQKTVGDYLDLDNPAPPRRPRTKGKPVTPDNNGVYHLTPATASVCGALRYQPDRNNLGAWFNRTDTPRWTLLDVQPGTYKVSFEYGCTNPGVAYTIRFGQKTLQGTSQSTGGIKTYKPFDLGTVMLRQGTVQVDVLPGPFKGPFMNYRNMTLTPLDTQ